MPKYYKTPNGYVATDSRVTLQANHTSVGKSLIFGRGPTVAGDPSTVTDTVFNPRLLGDVIEAENIPEEWQKALGIPVKNPDRMTGVEPGKLTKHEAAKDRGSDQMALFVVFVVGALLGRILAIII